MLEMLYAEWICIRMPLLQMAVRVGAVTLFGILLGGPMMLCMIVVMPAVLVPRMLFASILSEGWEAYSVTLPTRRQNAVASRYLLNLVCNVTAFIICLAGMMVYWRVTGVTGRFAQDIAVLLICMAWAMGASGILLAASYRWNMVQANYILLGGSAVLYLGIAVVKRVDIFHRVWQVWSSRIAEGIGGRGIMVALLLALIGWLIYGLCYAISVYTYQKKEL